ncbi:hypothetical protein BC941DRAFT_426250 [Chlamydoabsidia padenii]|nr:hypothetical protein BC941DRAFT_426250 [Chlamydoabsidia padenii]
MQEQDKHKKHQHQQPASSKLEWQQGIALQLSELFNNTIDPNQLNSCLESPKLAKHGTFALPLQRIQHLLKSEPWCSQSINEVAQWVATKIQPTQYIEKATASGPFVNFNVPKAQYLETILQQIIHDRDNYGFDTTPGSNTPATLITCDLPPVPLIFDSTHYRGLVLATFMQRSLLNQGRSVRMVNTMTVWNTEFGYFALAWQKYGQPPSSDSNLITYMNQIYLDIKQEALADDTINGKAQTYLLQLEQGHDETITLWQQLQDQMTNEYQLLFKERLCIEFDQHTFATPWEDLDVIYKLLDQCDGLIKTEDNDWKMDLESEGLGTPLLRQKGISTQLTRDITQIWKREQQQQHTGTFDEYHFCGHHSSRHYQQAHNILTKMNLTYQHKVLQRTLVDFGKVKSDTNSNFVFLECLNSLRQTMMEIMEENEGTEKYDAMMAQLGQLSATTRNKMLSDIGTTLGNHNHLSIQQLTMQHADKLAVCTMIIHQLGQRRSKPMTLSSSTPPDVFGNSGVFLQYVHARLCGIERQLVKRGLLSTDDDNQILPVTTTTQGMGTLLYQQEAFNVVELMTLFPYAVQQAHITMDPSTLVTYLFKLARMANQSLYCLRIKDVQKDLALARWTLFWAVKQTLANGLSTLGITPVSRM